MRIFAVSDLHVDHPPNMAWLWSLDASRYDGDAIVLAGDLTDDLGRLEEAFRRVTRTFSRVFFVPGNHELWIRRGGWRDSLEKFRDVIALCRDCGVETSPSKLGNRERELWVVPLLSWYVEPEQGHTSLFVDKPGEDPALSAWSDKYFVRWPPGWNGGDAARRFLSMNEPVLERNYDAPVLSFSHFLPRRELIFGTHISADRKRDPHPTFNFSRVAGCSGLDSQIRSLPARVHVYGHQHRNRDVVLDGVRYLSHCLGYPAERERGFLTENVPGLKLVWDARTGWLDGTTRAWPEVPRESRFRSL